MTRRRFHAGGMVGEGAFYVERAADRELPDALRRGEFCFVLDTRQLGKSSLRFHTAKVLTAEGIACVHLDLTGIGSATTTAESWYFGLTFEIADQLGLPPPDAFWEVHKGLGPVHAWSRYLEDEVLKGTAGRRLVIFVDEIDAMLSLPFSRDDFFAAVRAFYDRRTGWPERERLTFCLLGVAVPGDLIADPTRTPFNIGRAIRLEDFGHEEAAVLREGLEGLGEAPEALLGQVLAWTSGHPYMTLRLCADLAGPRRGMGVDDAVWARFLERGRTEDSNLQQGARWFEGRRAAGAQVPQMLRLYRTLLEGKRIAAEGSDPVQLALRLTGMAAEREAKDGRVLAVRNRIFGRVFDATWVRKNEADRVIVEPLQRWLDHGRREDFLLGDTVLAEVRTWAQGREDLTGAERDFLDACARREDRRRAEEDKRKALRRFYAPLVALSALLAVALGCAQWLTNRATKAEAKAEARRLASLAAYCGLQGHQELRTLLAIEAEKTAWDANIEVPKAANQALDAADSDNLPTSLDNRPIIRHSSESVVERTANFFLDIRDLQACARAGRNFTHSEWDAFMLDTPYRQTCPQWPEDPLPVESP